MIKSDILESHLRHSQLQLDKMSESEIRVYFSQCLMWLW